MTQYPLALEQFNLVLSAFCQLNHIPFDYQQYPLTYTSLQLKTKLCDKLQKTVNCINVVKNLSTHVFNMFKVCYKAVECERSIELSGLQKQRIAIERIAIARELLKQPEVMIFDEAVSSLDQQTAEHFAETVNKLKGKVNILFITHQLPTGLQVDEAVVLSKRC